MPSFLIGYIKFSSNKYLHNLDIFPPTILFFYLIIVVKVYL